MNQSEICPKCDKIKLPEATECPYCGLIYSKFKQRPEFVLIKNKPIYQKKIIKIPKIKIEYKSEISFFVTAGLLFIFSKFLGTIMIVWAIVYSLKNVLPAISDKKALIFQINQILK